MITNLEELIEYLDASGENHMVRTDRYSPAHLPNNWTPEQYRKFLSNESLMVFGHKNHDFPRLVSMFITSKTNWITFHFHMVRTGDETKWIRVV